MTVSSIWGFNFSFPLKILDLAIHDYNHNKELSHLCSKNRFYLFYIMRRTLRLSKLFTTSRRRFWIDSTAEFSLNIRQPQNICFFFFRSPTRFLSIFDPVPYVFNSTFLTKFRFRNVDGFKEMMKKFVFLYSVWPILNIQSPSDSHRARIEGEILTSLTT